MPIDPETILDHFKIWQVIPKDFAREVRLKGQFDDGKTIPERITRVEWIANPVMKNGHKVLNEKSHLLGYFLAQHEKPGPNRLVVLANQFHAEKDKTTWRLGDPAVLLLPASKDYKDNPPDPPADSDHYECYIVRDADKLGFDKTLTLEDQFDTKIGEGVEKIERLEPAFFALPVSKNGGKIKNRDVHLALYHIFPKRDARKSRIAPVTRDQFGMLHLEVEESLMLAVPTRKIAWTVEKLKVQPAQRARRSTSG